MRLVIQSRQHKGFGLFSMADSHTKLTVAAMAILERVRLDTQKDQLVAELSHGDQRKLEVALLIGLDPMVYMFDEPTAGMSVDEAPVILDLIAEIKADRERTVLLVEHKLDVIRSLADRIIVLHNGALAADGAPADVMASDVVQEAYMGRGLEGALGHD
jgi:branched-chain amino acid transport system ATP-binding protein